MSQFKNLSKQIERGEQVRPKHAMHLIRLLLSGITILEEGFVPVLVEAHRQRLLVIKAGELTWPQIEQWRMSLHARFDEVFEQSRLPERPNYAAVNDFLIKARRASVDMLP